MRKLITRLLLTLVLVLSSVALMPSQADAAANPGGKKYFVMSLVAFKPNAAFVRLSQWTFDAANATVTEQYWAWHQGMAPVVNDAYANRDLVGRTSGCALNGCSVYAPKGFKDAPSTRTGTFRNFESGGQPHVQITWPTGIYENYLVLSHNGYAELALVKHNYNALQGTTHVISRSYGSNKDFSTSYSAAQVAGSKRQLGSPASFGLTYPNQAGHNTYSQQWGGGMKSAYYNLNMGIYQACTSSNCMMNTDRTAQHNYWWFFGGTRKTAWFNMVTTPDMTPNASTCIATGRGGHNWAMLQVIDDSGVFRGFVGIEASLYGRTAPANYVAMIAALS